MGATSAETRLYSPDLKILPRNTSPTLHASAVSYFKSIPWCAALLNGTNTTTTDASSTNTNGSTKSEAITFIPSCRNPASPAHDQFFGVTLSNPRAIPHVLAFFHPLDPLHAHDPARPVTHISTFYALGPGISGFPSIVHGGMTMAMVDEATGIVHELNTALGKSDPVFDATSLTGSMDVKFLKPIPTQGVVCATAWVESVEGRKTRMRCVLRDKDGVELAKCSSLWIRLKNKL